MNERADHRRTGPRPGVAPAIAAGFLLLALAADPGAAQQAPLETTTIENGQLRYAVSLPSGCRQEEGAGTIDAICAADFDSEKSAVVGTTAALVLSVAAEALAAEGDTSVDALRQRYDEAGFRDELPEAVCGETDKARVKIEKVKATAEAGRLVYTAEVVCAPVKFLQIGERRAAVRHVIAPDMRYRLAARGPTEDFERQRAAIDAFFASFRPLSAESPPHAEK